MSKESELRRLDQRYPGSKSSLNIPIEDPVAHTQNTKNSQEESITLPFNLSVVIKTFLDNPNEEISTDKIYQQITQNQGIPPTSIYPCLNALKNRKLLCCSESNQWSLNPNTDISKLILTQENPNSQTDISPKINLEDLPNSTSLTKPQKPIKLRPKEKEPWLIIFKGPIPPIIQTEETTLSEHQTILVQSLEAHQSKPIARKPEKRSELSEPLEEDHKDYYKAHPHTPNPNTGLTKSEEELLKIVIDYNQKEAKFPTIRTICSLTGLKSLDSVYQKLEKLTSQGYLKHTHENTYRNKRSWTLTDKTLD